MTTGKEQAPFRRGHEREDADPRNPLLHLSTCLAVGAVVILVILAIHWLTLQRPANSKWLAKR